MARESLFHTFASSLARHLARDSPHPEAAYLTLVSVIYAQAAAIFGGERVYGPRTNQVELELARERITSALQSGETPTQIAKREGVSRELANKLRRRLRGTIEP
jgi:hypothetical protein